MTNEAEATEKGRLVKLLGDLAIKEGFSSSHLRGVVFIRSNKPFPRMPVVYEPSIVIVGQGEKIGYLGDQVYLYDPFNYLVLSVPLPFECETLATLEEPYLSVSVRVDPVTVGELLIEMDDDSGAGIAVPRGICSTPLRMRSAPNCRRPRESPRCAPDRPPPSRTCRRRLPRVL